MSRVSRGRPTIIDKIRVDVPGTEKSVIVQYVGHGDTVQVELSGVWDLSTYVPQAVEAVELRPSLLLEAKTSDAAPAFSPEVSSVELINGTLIVAVSSYNETSYVCSLVYPAELQWAISSFERSDLGDAGRTRVTLTLDREPTEEESEEIKERIKTRRSRSSVKS